MRLFLASRAGSPATLEKLREYVGGFKGKSIAYIPTAANGEEEFGSWRYSSDTWKTVQTLGAKVTPVQLEDYKNSSVIKELENKDIIWVAGGYCGYLMYWIRRCEIDKALPNLLKKSLYVGSSAGSMITADKLSDYEEPGVSVIPGLGLVDFDFYPHYDEAKFLNIKKFYKGEKMYLVKDGEEIIVENGKISVVGETRLLP